MLEANWSAANATITAIQEELRVRKALSNFSRWSRGQRRGEVEKALLGGNSTQSCFSGYFASSTPNKIY